MTGSDAAAPPKVLWRDILDAALKEDLGFRDLTSEALVGEELEASATFVCRQPGRVAGLEIALEAVRTFDDRTVTEAVVRDGDDVDGGAVLVRVFAKARALLAAERVALNFLGHLSGIATATRKVVQSIEGSGARVTETRKTTPGLRLLEKYAVRLGGGFNHRYRLDDAILIKDNHVAICGGLREAIRRVGATVGHMVRVEVEVDDLDQLDIALEEEVDVILLDNFDLPTLEEAVRRNAGRAVLEASGGITPESAPAVAATGVDVLSIGWLTQSAPTLDVAVDFSPSG
jgi:nicotinate-nucleotide pyrophosphorylase (carboxylating)